MMDTKFRNVYLRKGIIILRPMLTFMFANMFTSCKNVDTINRWNM